MEFNTVDIMLPFRTDTYYDSDIIFTKIIKKEYMKLSNEQIKLFDKFTENIMNDNIITQRELMKEIISFELYDTSKNILCNKKWNKFANKVYEIPSCCNLF